MIPECYKTTFAGKTLTKGRSDHHSYEFLHHSDFGLCLFLDGILQSAEHDQHTYHDKLVRAALQEQPSPSDVLIIGGAGGGAVHHLKALLGDSGCRITVVDIDEKLFSLGLRLMGAWGSHSLQGTHVKKIFEDGSEYLRKTDQQYDIILLDVGDPLPHTKSN